ncbi:uncharacterized protein LOC112087303 [Eutrema salsugineum]|uniref:uncharacterized protein LOC112087303 n=1 Tax=Eutrema salsugineum TaxID=72664 RepID=UPI000CECED2E|nr:uncharacterized protein LOC112087303 [Eutrema salsugineum]
MEAPASGSWIWCHLLKLRSTARPLHRMKVNDGESTSFWYDAWSDLDPLVELAGVSGFIALGISPSASVASVIRSHRSRRHRRDDLNSIEDIISLVAGNLNQKNDHSLWKSKSDKFSSKFVSETTWHNIWHSSPLQRWSFAVWFPGNTPKFAYITWLAMQNRLSTGEIVKQWGPGMSTRCVLCLMAIDCGPTHVFAIGWDAIVPCKVHLSSLACDDMEGTESTQTWRRTNLCASSDSHPG